MSIYFSLKIIAIFIFSGWSPKVIILVEINYDTIGGD